MRRVVVLEDAEEEGKTPLKDFEGKGGEEEAPRLGGPSSTAGSGWVGESRDCWAWLRIAGLHGQFRW